MIVVVELKGMLGAVWRQLQWWRVVVVVEGWCLFPCGGDWWWGLRFSWLLKRQENGEMVGLDGVIMDYR